MCMALLVFANMDVSSTYDEKIMETAAGIAELALLVLGEMFGYHARRCPTVSRSALLLFEFSTSFGKALGFP